MLKKTFGKKKTDILGVDVGTNVTKVIRCHHPQVGKPKITFIGKLEAKPEEANYPALLHNFLSKNQLLGLGAAICIDDPSLKIRKISLPKMPDSDLKDAIAWKMRDVVEGSIGDYVVRSSQLEAEKQSGGKNMQMVGYAMHKKVISDFMQRIELAGIHPLFVEPSAVSQAAIIESIYPSTDHWIAGIDLGSHNAIMVIMGHGKFHFSRPLPGIKMGSSKTLAEGFEQKLAAEIQNTLDTFAVTFQVETIHKIFLSGGGAAHTAIKDYLTTNLGIESEILNPYFNFEIDPSVQEASEKEPYSYALAASLAQIKV